MMLGIDLDLSRCWKNVEYPPLDYRHLKKGLGFFIYLKKHVKGLIEGKLLIYVLPAIPLLWFFLYFYNKNGNQKEYK